MKMIFEDVIFSELSRLLFEYKEIEISPSTIRNRFYEKGVLSVKCNKKTRKKLRKALREQQKIATLNLEKNPNIKPSRSRRA